MPPTGPDRRLSAILAADMVGYSRQIERDEAGTVARLKADREEFIDPTIAAHGGRIVRLAGDGVLIEFPSVVEATQCAIDIQRGMPHRNADRGEAEKVVFRIGVNTGDIIVEDDNLHGEGINIAARLESLCEPGGILLSEAATQYVEGKIDAAIEFVEERKVKNIERPVRIWRVREDRSPAAVSPTSTRRGRLNVRSAAALVGVALALFAAVLLWYMLETPRIEAHDEQAVLPLPDKPSLAVLPFDNLSGDPDQEYFADGFTEDLITDLSKLRGLFVIARNSSFAYKGKSPDVRTVGRELGVRYVLEGSVRGSGDRVRVNAQLVDSTSGDHLWAERYDQEVTDIFSVQDDIGEKIVGALDIALVEGEQSRAWRRTTANSEAYKLFLQGRENHLQFTKESNYLAKEQLEQAVELDPEFTMGWVYLGWTHDALAFPGWSENPLEHNKRAIEYANRALALDNTLGNAHALLAESNGLIGGEVERTLEEIETALKLSPNDSKVLAVASLWRSIYGMPDKGLELIRKAKRINPFPPHWFNHPSGMAKYGLGDLEQASEDSKRCVDHLPDFIWCYFTLVKAYQSLGRQEEAQWAARNVLRIAPDYRIEPYRTNDEKRLFRMAGLPE